ncbi:MAG: hypothetical protein QF718_01870, partial [Phycisphaerales bacterium]|nr:hypothetical protein [Phycisphaerales bacterium]
KEKSGGEMEVMLMPHERRDHMGNFLDAIRNGDELACNVDLGCSTMVGIKMAVDALQQDKVLRWNGEDEKVVSSSESPKQILAGLALPSFAC